MEDYSCLVSKMSDVKEERINIRVEEVYFC